MRIATMLSEQVARYLDLASTQAKLTASNMSNVDTPGYKALGMDFQAEMQSAIAGTEVGLQPGPVHVGLEDGLIARPMETTFRWIARALTWPRRN